MGRHDMIKQVFHIKDKWKVIVYYNIDYDLYYNIIDDMKTMSIPIEEIDDIHHTMSTYNAYGFTISNISKRISLVGFNKHKSKIEYISTIVHELEHVKQDILKYYRVNDIGEPPAYLIGYLISKVYHIIKKLII